MSNNFIYLITTINDWDYRENGLYIRSFIICAKNEDDARLTAHDNGSREKLLSKDDEGNYSDNYWKSPVFSTCKKIGLAVEDIELGVIQKTYL